MDSASQQFLTQCINPIFSFTGRYKIIVPLKGISWKVGMLLMREVRHKREIRKGRIWTLKSRLL
jgi:hypothetical protein